jgi:hypothetical protein
MKLESVVALASTHEDQGSRYDHSKPLGLVRCGGRPQVVTGGVQEGVPGMGLGG